MQLPLSRRFGFSQWLLMNNLRRWDANLHRRPICRMLGRIECRLRSASFWQSRKYSARDIPPPRRVANAMRTISTVCTNIFEFSDRDIIHEWKLMRAPSEKSGNAANTPHLTELVWSIRKPGRVLITIEFRTNRSRQRVGLDIHVSSANQWINQHHVSVFSQKGQRYDKRISFWICASLSLLTIMWEIISSSMYRLSSDQAIEEGLANSIPTFWTKI